jgi:hypothetical protein
MAATSMWDGTEGMQQEEETWKKRRGREEEAGNEKGMRGIGGSRRGRDRNESE